MDEPKCLMRRNCVPNALQELLLKDAKIREERGKALKDYSCIVVNYVNEEDVRLEGEDSE